MLKKTNVVDMGGKGNGVNKSESPEKQKVIKNTAPKSQAATNRGAQEASDILALKNIHDKYQVQWIDFAHLNINLKAFQNRKKPYSETTVAGIIEAVLNGTFMWHICDPIRVWQDKDGKLYVIAGHSRLEAFGRLSHEPYVNDKRVKEFLKRNKMQSFRQVPTIVLPKSTPLEDAKFIALMSNTLASYETDTERAFYYFELRKLRKLTKKELETRMRTFEKANWSKIDAYSYLNPAGKAIEMLDAFELSNGVDGLSNDMKKAAYWTGISRKRIPKLSNLHEKEIFDWLLEGNYGNKDSNYQFSKFEKFFDFLSTHIEKITTKGEFHGSKLLNLKNARSMPLAMKTYYEMRAQLYQRKAEIAQMLVRDVNKINQNILEGQTDLFSAESISDGFVQGTASLTHVIAQIEKDLQKITKTIENDEHVKAAWKQYELLMAKVDIDIKKHKSKKGKFEDAGNQENLLF